MSGLCNVLLLHREPGAVVLPLIGGCCEYLRCVGYGLIHILLAMFSLATWDAVGCCGIILATIGPRMIQGFVFPYPSCEVLVLLHACSGWSSDCVEWD